MAKLIAVDWDDREIRLACGGRQGSGIAVDAVRTIPMPTTTDDIYQSVAVAIRKFIEDLHLSKPSLVASVPRGSLELRAMQLPSADDNELPSIVRFAAQRNFAQIGDSWPLDFLKLPPTEQEGLPVLAGAVNPSVITKLQAACAPLELSGLLVRSIAMANLTVAAVAQLRDECVLIVNVVGQEADLVVAESGQVTMTRTVRLPEKQEGQGATSLLAEIKRTRFAAESQRGTARPTRIVLWGDCGEGPDVVALIENGTGINVTQVFVQQLADCKSLKNPSESLESYASLVGMIHHEVFKDARSLDFLHPRQPEAERSPYWTIGAIAGTAALVLVAAIWWYVSEHKKLDRQIVALTEESNNLDENVKNANYLIARWDKIQRFEKANIQWLDQLLFLSDQSLPADRVIFDKTSFTANAQTQVGKISTTVAAISPETITELEARLRGNGHAVQVKKTIESKDKGIAYKWIGDPVIEIRPDQVVPPQSLAQDATKQESHPESNVVAPVDQVGSKEPSPLEAEEATSREAVLQPEQAESGNSPAKAESQNDPKSEGVPS